MSPTGINQSGAPRAGMSDPNAGAGDGLGSAAGGAKRRSGGLGSGGFNLAGLATALAKRSDLLFALFFLIVVSMMILPLPTLLVDALIGFNLAFALVVLITTIYLRSALELSTFPAIILIGAIFRLALTISTARLILADGDAGEIISAFGSFVVAGNVVVGLVVFLIVALVQFIVVTKGAERIAEVGARFTLDAMPGKQLAIDSDLRNGHITPQQASRRRAVIEQESQFFGAMDGAMRFVKGDAIASLVVVAVNLIGGLAIGIFQRGLSFSEAAHLYSLLSIGDGLVAQIPSMLMAIAAGTVVTRVTSEETGSLGLDIGRQLSRDPRALGVASVMTFAMGFVPGFPALVLWSMGIVLGLITFHQARRGRTRLQPAASPVEAGEQVLDQAKFGDPIVATVSDSTLAYLNQNGFAGALENRIRMLARTVGVAVTVPTFNADPRMADALIHVQVENVPAGTVALDGSDMDQVAQAICRIVRRHVGATFSIEDVNQWLSSLESRLGRLASDVRDTVPQMLMVAVARQLLEAGVTLSQPRGFLEVMLNHGQISSDPDILAEEARQALGAQVAYGLLDNRGILNLLPLGPDWEEAVHDYRSASSAQSRLAAQDRLTHLAHALNNRLTEASRTGLDLVGLVEGSIRPLTQKLLAQFGCRLPLISPEEVVPELSCDMLPVLRAENQSAIA